MDNAQISSLVVKAARLHQAGRLPEAESLYDEVLAHAPENLDALNLKGMIAADAGRHREAVELFDRAILSHTSAIEPYYNKGLSLTALGDHAGALAAYTTLVARNPSHADGQNNRAMLLQKTGHVEAALAASREMTEHCPGDFRGFYNLALLSLQSGRYPEAAAAAERAHHLDPTSPHILGLCAEAAFACTDFDTAAKFAQQALTLNDDIASAHRVLADTMMRRRRYDDASLHYQRALALKPGLVETRANYGLLLLNTGHQTEAEEEYRKALRLQPSSAAARQGLSAALLAQGKFAEGWPLYAERNIAKDPTRNPSKRPLMFAPPQRGERLQLLCDQGLGEQILFAGLLPDLLEITDHVQIRCDPRLHALFKRSFPNIHFTQQAEKLSGTLADAAQWLRPNFGSFPRHQGYLHPDIEKRDALRRRYKNPDNRPLVGISWMTGPNLKFSDAKSIPLQEWAPLLSHRKAKFVSLQYGDVGAEIAAVNSRLNTDVILDSDIDTTSDIDGLAAQVAAMDLVITTSNTTAHVAGALNVPTLVLAPLGFGMLWHWFLEREDSPWYPSVRLLRQARQGDWGDVLHHAAGALASFIAAEPRSHT